MSSLYSLTQEQKHILDSMDSFTDMETGEISEEYFKKLEEVENSIYDKADNIGAVYRSINTDILAIEQEINRLLMLKTQKDKKIANLEKYLKSIMEMKGVNKLEGKFTEFSIKETKRTIIDDDSLIPEEYKVREIIPEQEVVKIPKDGLKKAIEGGATIP